MSDFPALPYSRYQADHQWFEMFERQLDGVCTAFICWGASQRGDSALVGANDVATIIDIRNALTAITADQPRPMLEVASEVIAELTLGIEAMGVRLNYE